MKKLLFMFLAAGLFLAYGTAAEGDTGTYRIVDYRVALTPHSDGTVAIDYYQKWLVTGGHIPWITVGVPNSNFVVSGHGGAAIGAVSASQGGWSGVRVDLDSDYRKGQTFEASFSIVQRGLLYADKESYGLDFTPGWYDRAQTDSLRVSVKFFADLKTVTSNPQPSFVSGDEMAWAKYGLGPGEHFTIHVSFPVGLFAGKIDKSNLKGGSGGGVSLGIAIFLILGVVFFCILWAIFVKKTGYSGGNIFYGGILGGRSGGSGAGGGRSSGGGGGFGGSSMSCACACVSCACACACAGGGGGGAGCGRKLEHTCPDCEKRNG